jgi:glycosyltransferase involved in cell wall biosynthesis
LTANTNTKWICCQLGAREHYAVARALHRHHSLDLLLTDAWIAPKNPLGRLKPSLYARFHAELAAASVYASNLGSITFELRAKLAGLCKWARIIARNEWFQKVAVAKLSGLRPVDTSRTLMAYSYAALKPFKWARARGWRTVLGQIDPGPPEERIIAKLYDEDPLQRGTWQRPPLQYWSAWREECTLADRIVVNSRWSREALVAEGIPAEKIRIVPLAYDEPNIGSYQREYPAAFSPTRPLRALFLGQINLRKGIGPLFDAIRLSRGQPIEFSFVGPIQISIPPDLRDDPQVRWVGPVSREETDRFYRNADIFLFPTFSDGFGLTQLEAQAWKLPILATTYCGDVVKDGRNGWLLLEATPWNIAAILRSCLANPARLQELSDHSETSKRFGLARIGEQWLNVFD